MIKQLIRDSSGMLLIGVMASVVLVALISLVLYAMCFSAMSWTLAARSETMAGSTAFAILESLRDNRSDIPWGASGRLAIPDEVDPGVELPAGMTASLETTPYMENDHLFRVIVKIEWKGPKERRNLEMATLVRENP